MGCDAYLAVEEKREHDVDERVPLTSELYLR